MASVVAVRDIPGMAPAGDKFEVYGVEPHIFAEDLKFLISTPEGWRWVFAFHFRPCNI